MKNFAQTIVDAIEQQDGGLNYVGGNSVNRELFFETNTAEVDGGYLDLAFDEATMITAVKVYEGNHDGQPVVVVQILEA